MQLFFNAPLIFPGLEHSIKERRIEQMNDAERDFLMWKNKRGRYAPGGKLADATRPLEGGTAAAGYVPKAGKVTSRPQAAYRSHNGAPEPIEALDTMPYAPPRMQADPFDGSAKAKAGALEPEMPEPIAQDAEAPEDAYTPIACYLEGSPAGSIQ
jgi:hypothetical protein